MALGTRRSLQGKPAFSFSLSFPTFPSRKLQSRPAPSTARSMPDTIDAALRLSPSVTSLAKTDDEADSPNEVRHDVHTERAQGGVARIEDLYKVFNGKKIWLLYAAIGLIVYA